LLISNPHPTFGGFINFAPNSFREVRVHTKLYHDLLHPTRGIGGH
jgi:hypothetical protein